MRTFKFRSIIVAIFVISLFLLGNVQNKVNLETSSPVEDLRNGKLSALEPIYDTSEPTIPVKVEGEAVNYAIQSSGTIVEDSDDFLKIRVESIDMTVESSLNEAYRLIHYTQIFLEE